MNSRPVLVLGGSGYVGNRLVPLLLTGGQNVRASSRSPGRMKNRRWADHPNVRLVGVDALKPASLRKAMAGCGTVYYLVHSMAAGRRRFERLDLQAASHVADAARDAGVQRIVYLGGLGVDSPRLSHHLRSRHEVGKTLAEGAVPVVELRAAMVIGNGSASFEILRYLVEHLPAMVTPRWVRVPLQPIGIRDILAYLEAAARPDLLPAGVYDVGAPDVVTYDDLFRLYADLQQLPRRAIVPVPVLSPRLSSYWIRLVTPVPSSIARPLAEGLRNRVVCTESRIRDLVPRRLLTVEEAMRATIEAAERTFFNPERAASLVPEAPQPGDPSWSGGTVFEDERRIVLPVSTRDLWRRVEGVGRTPRWHGLAWMWHLRGVLDRMVGGEGGRSGRPNSAEFHVGDTLDSWRVRAVERGHKLQLVSEMKLPGQGLLEFFAEPHGEGTMFRQVVRFRPRGLGGLVYWAGLLPAHLLVFHRLFTGLTRELVPRAVDVPQAPTARPA